MNPRSLEKEKKMITFTDMNKIQEVQNEVAVDCKEYFPGHQVVMVGFNEQELFFNLVRREGVDKEALKHWLPKTRMALVEFTMEEVMAFRICPAVNMKIQWKF